MDWLNYHHLHYFWAAAKHGSVTAAAAALGIGQPAISAQIHTLEKALGAKLFEREGRALRLTADGKLAYDYAAEIFGIGQELLDALRGRGVGKRQRFCVGLADAVPKLVALRLLAPALRQTEPLRLVCREGSARELAAALANHELDLAIADHPLPPGTRAGLHQRLLGSSALVVAAAPALARRLQADFPAALDGAPFLLPGAESAVRRQLETWFQNRQLRPDIRAEFDDTALLKLAAEQGEGAFAAPAALLDDIQRRHGVLPVGTLEGAEASYYVWHATRRARNPAAAAVIDAADTVFSAKPIPGAGPPRRR